MEFIKQKKMLALFRGLVGVIILILLTLGSREFFGTFRIRVLEKAIKSSFNFIFYIYSNNRICSIYAYVSL